MPSRGEFRATTDQTMEILEDLRREAHLRLEIATLGSPEAQPAAGDIERLREEHLAGQEALTAGHNGDVPGSSRTRREP